ncbi:hypothetical protein EGW08_006317 [Elysia chlorotica]|uniref:EGF-like domain-containing protein n=1 Tax=Elysia chlorotica TaxID=188477 RepID=A0A433TWF0_ELYCH|nr:hypothetical protein EGW08_006317 [Elysia chlorotica]
MTMLLQQVLLVMLVLLAQSQAMYYGSAAGGGSYNSRLHRHARCSSSAKPCRLKFELFHLNNTLISRTASQQCSCNSNQGECSNDWTNSNKVISRNLRSDDMKVNLHMMFCNTVTPATECDNNQVSLEISGFMAIPNDVDNHACRCRNTSQPLYLVERRLANNRFYHKYVCADSWPTCSANNACMRVRSDRTDYFCECPSNLVCRLSGPWVAGTIEEIVYCSSR